MQATQALYTTSYYLDCNGDPVFSADPLTFYEQAVREQEIKALSEKFNVTFSNEQLRYPKWSYTVTGTREQLLALVKWYFDPDSDGLEYEIMHEYHSWVDSVVQL